MSKKLFIMLISSVLVCGIAATIAVFIVFSPFYKTQRAVDDAVNAVFVQVVVRQDYYGELVNKKTYEYTKGGDCYDVVLRERFLSNDPLSPNVYEDFTRSFQSTEPKFLFFNFKSSYVTRLEYIEYDEEGISGYSAKVKDSCIPKFFDGLDGSFVIENVVISVVCVNGVAQSVQINFTISDNDFIVLEEFYYSD